MSDLHLDHIQNAVYFEKNGFPIVGDILILAGNILPLKNRDFKTSPFWSFLSDNFEQVYVLIGNTDLYCDDISNYPLDREVFTGINKENIHHYLNHVVRRREATYIFSTLWSHLPEEYDNLEKIDLFRTLGVDDFLSIYYKGKYLTIQQYNSLHDKCVSFIRDNIVKSKTNSIFVVTHHAPLLSLCKKKNKLAYCSDCNDLLNIRPVKWIYGHTRDNITAPNIYSNQFGYVHDLDYLSNNFSAVKYIEI